MNKKYSVRGVTHNKQSRLSLANKALTTTYSTTSNSELHSVPRSNLKDKYFPRQVLHINTKQFKAIPFTLGADESLKYTGSLLGSPHRLLSPDKMELNGAISPPPAFPGRKQPSKQFVGSFCSNSGNEVTKTLADMHLIEIENMQLRRRCTELRNQKVQSEHTVNMLKKENKELNRQIKEKGLNHFEENSMLTSLLNEIKSLFGNYKNQLEITSKTFQNLTEYINNQIKTSECNCGYSKLLEVLNEKWYLSSGEIMKAKKLEMNINHTIRNLNKIVNLKSDTINIKKSDYLTMQIHIEELKDELKLSKKWKEMCMSMLTNNLQMTENTGSITERNRKEVITLQSLKRDAEELKEELINKEMLNIDLHEMTIENKTLKDQLNELKELLHQKGVDDVIYKMSLIILKTFTEDGFTEKETTLVQKLFGAKLIKEFQEQTKELNQMKINCKNLVQSINGVVICLR